MSAKAKQATDAQPDLSATLRALYSAMQSIENKLGGGEGIEGLYGSITQSGTQKIFASMGQHCSLDSDSVLVDIGAGLGRPLLHALVYPGVKSTYGVELDAIKVRKAGAFLKQTVLRLQQKGLFPDELELPTMQCAAIEDVASLEHCTHAYSFWEGVPTTARQAFGHLVASSSKIRGVAVVQRAMRDPEGSMASLGFGNLTLRASFPVSMSGSGRSFTAYVFEREVPQVDGERDLRGIDSAPLLPSVVSTPEQSPDRGVRNAQKNEIVQKTTSPISPPEPTSAEETNSLLQISHRPAPSSDKPEEDGGAENKSKEEEEVQAAAKPSAQLDSPTAKGHQSSSCKENRQDATLKKSNSKKAAKSPKRSQTTRKPEQPPPKRTSPTKAAALLQTNLLTQSLRQVKPGSVEVTTNKGGAPARQTRSTRRGLLFAQLSN